MRSLAAILVATALAGCAPSPAQWASQDISRCESYGFTPGSQGFANCRMHLDTARQQRIQDALDSVW